MKPILAFLKADAFTFGYSSRYLLWVFVIGGILNILLDPIFIFEKGDPLFGGALNAPFGFGMDVSGAAVATMISNTVSMIYLLSVFGRIRKKTALSIDPRRVSLARDVTFNTCAVGFPAAISVLLVSVSIAVLFPFNHPIPCTILILSFHSILLKHHSRFELYSIIVLFGKRF